MKNLRSLFQESNITSVIYYSYDENAIKVSLRGAEGKIFRTVDMALKYIYEKYPDANVTIAASPGLVEFIK